MDATAAVDEQATVTPESGQSRREIAGPSPTAAPMLLGRPASEMHSRVSVFTRRPVHQPTARMTWRVTSRIRPVSSGGNGSVAGSGTSTVVVTTPGSARSQCAPNRSRILRIA